MIQFNDDNETVISDKADIVSFSTAGDITTVVLGYNSVEVELYYTDGKICRKDYNRLIEYIKENEK